MPEPVLHVCLRYWRRLIPGPHHAEPAETEKDRDLGTGRPTGAAGSGEWDGNGGDEVAHAELLPHVDRAGTIVILQPEPGGSRRAVPAWGRAPRRSHRDRPAGQSRNP